MLTLLGGFRLQSRSIKVKERGDTFKDGDLNLQRRNRASIKYVMEVMHVLEYFEWHELLNGLKKVPLEAIGG